MGKKIIIGVFVLVGVILLSSVILLVDKKPTEFYNYETVQGYSGTKDILNTPKVVNDNFKQKENFYVNIDDIKMSNPPTYIQIKTGVFKRE